MFALILENPIWIPVFIGMIIFIIYNVADILKRRKYRRLTGGKPDSIRLYTLEGTYFTSNFEPKELLLRGYVYVQNPNTLFVYALGRDGTMEKVPVLTALPRRSIEDFFVVYILQEQRGYNPRVMGVIETMYESVESSAAGFTRSPRREKSISCDGLDRKLRPLLKHVLLPNRVELSLRFKLAVWLNSYDYLVFNILANNDAEWKAVLQYLDSALDERDIKLNCLGGRGDHAEHRLLSTKYNLAEMLVILNEVVENADVSVAYSYSADDSTTSESTTPEVDPDLART